MATVEDYEQFRAALPLPHSINLFGQNEVDRWFVVAHAMMLRKYFSGDLGQPESGDHLNLNAVVRALRIVYTDETVTPGMWEAMEDNSKRIVESVKYEIEGVEIPEATIISNELYARYLHGNPSKWRSRIKFRSTVDQALLRGTNARAWRVAMLADLIRESVRDGVMTLDPPADGAQKKK